MSASLSLTESQILDALRGVLLRMLPAGVGVYRSEINRVSEPSEANFIMLTPILRARLATNIATYIDLPLATPPVGLVNTLAPTQVTIQLDVHGPASADNAQLISTLLRDAYACAAFAASGYDVQPLYAGDPRQSVFEDAEQQQEMRWILDAVLQANATVTSAQDFAASLQASPTTALI